MSPFRFVYHEGYDLNLGEHVFPSKKFRLVRERLIEEGIAAPEDFLRPEPSPEEDLLRVHDADWVRKLAAGTLTYRDIMKLEIPYSSAMVRAFWLAAGGTTLAARRALEDGVSYNVGGGFHHAFRGHGEGFCAINDIAIAIRRLLAEGRIARALVADCDVHHGNGTAAIFAGDPAVFTLSIHQFENYPTEKPPSTLDIHLADNTPDGEYIAKLRGGYLAALESFRPELVVYVAGADPFYQDQLGGLSLSFEGLMDRDNLIIEYALRQGAGVAVVLAGGYAVRVEDTVTIHCNTARAAARALAVTGRR
jgi:acetoin utilization deacetylase AcuC-like enzyme